jgi:hypothetical protein
VLHDDVPFYYEDATAVLATPEASLE